MTDMLNNGHKQDCGFAETMVSYIYDEANAGERRKFELHIGGCSACTDEFAAISDARFSVFEWQREEFANLPTPQIVIPHSAKTVNQENPGFFTGIRSWFAFPAVPVAIAATLLVFAGLGFIVFNGFGDDKLLANVDVKAPIAPATSKPVSDVPQPVLSKDEKAEAEEQPVIDEAVRSATAGSVKTPRQPKAAKRPTPTRTTTARNAKAPVLSPYEEMEDKSLRLSDLFDDGGGGR